MFGHKTFPTTSPPSETWRQRRTLPTLDNKTVMDCQTDTWPLDLNILIFLSVTLSSEECSTHNLQPYQISPILFNDQDKVVE